MRRGLRERALALFDQWCVSRARAAYTSVSGHRSARPGFAGMVEEMEWGLSKLSEPRRAEADRRVLTAVFFGPFGLATLARLHARYPEAVERLMARAAPYALHWLVGDIVPREPRVDLLPSCEFRRLGGEELCQHVCRSPTESFCAKNAVPVSLRPRPDSLACEWHWGVGPEARR